MSLSGNTFVAPWRGG